MILRVPGALDSAGNAVDGALEPAVMSTVGEALDRLNQMREQEGRSIERELRERMDHLRAAVKVVQDHRRAMLQTYTERLQSRLQELLGASPDRERVLQKRRSWSTAAIFKRKLFASKTTSSISWICSTSKEKLERNSTSCCRK